MSSSNVNLPVTTKSTSGWHGGDTEQTPQAQVPDLSLHSSNTSGDVSKEPSTTKAYAQDAAFGQQPSSTQVAPPTASHTKKDEDGTTNSSLRTDFATSLYWRKIYQTVSGYSNSVDKLIVAEILSCVKDELLEGLLYFEAYTKESYVKWLSLYVMEDYMNHFMQDLSKYLNLSTITAQAILNNYIMFEYYGKLGEIKKTVKSRNTRLLKEYLFKFYISERMFLLKTLRIIFEFYINSEHRFSSIYKALVKAIDMPLFQDRLIEQYKVLAKEFVKTKNLEEEHFDALVFRNNREQIEVLSLITLTTRIQKFKPKQVCTLIRLFMCNNFGGQIYYNRKRIKVNIAELLSVEIGCYHAILHNYWDEDLADLLKEMSDDVDKGLLRIPIQYEQTIIVLTYALLKIQKNNMDEFYANFFSLVFQKQPFVSLHTLLKNFRPCVSTEIMIEAIFRAVEELYTIQDSSNQFMLTDGVQDVVVELLKYKRVADMFLLKRNGLDNLISIALETFPANFESLTRFARVLLKHPEYYEKILNQLRALPFFLTDIPWGSGTLEVRKLNRPLSVLPQSNLIVFPENTISTTYEWKVNLVQYRGVSYSYFTYFEYLLATMDRDHYPKKLVDKAVLGYRIIIAILKYTKDIETTLLLFEKFLEKLTLMLYYFDENLQLDVIEIVYKIYYSIIKHEKMPFRYYCPVVIDSQFFPKIHPTLLHDDLKLLLFNQNIFMDNLFDRLFKNEASADKHDLMLLYVKIVYHSAVVTTNDSDRNFLLQNLIYIINQVFFQHRSWTSRNKELQENITFYCLKIFHEILQKAPTSMASKEAEIYNFLLNAFLNHSNITEGFIKLFMKDQHYFISIMEGEVNWKKGKSVIKLKCIQMQLALLLLLMNNKDKADQKPTILEKKVQEIVIQLTFFFSNIYSSTVAELSCRILQRLVDDRNLLMLAQLGFDHNQVQILFLEKLRDPLESDGVKSAIIDFISACIGKQDGMTCAFFNIKCCLYYDEYERDFVVPGTSVSSFAVDYLQNIKQSLDFFKNPLQLGILKLLWKLWTWRHRILTEQVTTIKDFWPTMFAPFKYDFVHSPIVYTITLKIIVLELEARKEDADKSLLNTIEDFFKNDIEHLRKWLEVVFGVASDQADTTLEERDLLIAWMEFVILTKNVTPQVFNVDSKKAILNSVLNGLSQPFVHYDNNAVGCKYGAMYMSLIKSWPEFYKNNEVFVVKTLTKIFQSYATQGYKHFSVVYRTSLLTIIASTLNGLQDYLDKNNDILMEFLAPVADFLDLEYKLLFERENWEALDCWLPIISIATELLEFAKHKMVALWFVSRRFIERTFMIVIAFTESTHTIRYAKVALKFLLSYASSSLYRQFLKIDMFQFYSTLKPPTLTISLHDALKSGLSTDLKEWWMIFIFLAKINRKLIERFDEPRNLKNCFTFLIQQHSSFSEILYLIRHTLDLTALNLVSEILILFHTLLEDIDSWNRHMPYASVQILEGLKISVNACILSVIGSKKISIYKISETRKLELMPQPPTEYISGVVNKLMQLIFLLSRCLLRFKPPLYRLVNWSLDDESSTKLFENDFSVPRFELPIVPELTWGRILCLTHYLCKTLNHVSVSVDVSDNFKGNNSEIYDKCTAFMVYIDRLEYVASEKLNSFLHFTEYSGSQSSLVSQLNNADVKFALEALISLVASEIVTDLKSLNGENLIEYKSEFISEIQFFYEFVRKKSAEQLHNVSASPRNLVAHEADIMKKYLMAKQNNPIDIADNNFYILIWHLLSNICALSN